MYKPSPGYNLKRMDRRDFLRLGLGAAAISAVGGLPDLLEAAVDCKGNNLCDKLRDKKFYMLRFFEGNEDRMVVLYDLKYAGDIFLQESKHNIKLKKNEETGELVTPLGTIEEAIEFVTYKRSRNTKGNLKAPIPVDGVKIEEGEVRKGYSPFTTKLNGIYILRRDGNYNTADFTEVETPVVSPSGKKGESRKWYKLSIGRKGGLDMGGPTTTTSTSDSESSGPSSE